MKLLAGKSSRGGADRWLWLGVFVVVGVWSMVLAWPKSADAAASADRVEWRTDVEKALEEAEATGRPVLMNFTADWCPPCQEMRAKVYSDAELAAWLGEAFVPVKVDLTAPGEREQALSARYHVQYIPTLIVTEADGKAVASAGGFIPKEDLRGALAKLLESREAKQDDPKDEAKPEGKVEAGAQES